MSLRRMLTGVTVTAVVTALTLTGAGVAQADRGLGGWASSAAATPLKPLLPLPKAAAVVPHKTVPTVKRAAVSTLAAAPRVTNAYGYNLVAGPHLSPVSRYEFMGNLRNNGRLGYCIDYAARLGAIQPWRQVPVGGVAWQMITYVINAHGNTANPTQAAAANEAANRASGNRGYLADRAGYLAQLNRRDPRVVPLANSYYNDALAHHGPYTTTVRATPVLVGQHGRATISVVAATRRGVPGANVRLAYSGAAGPATGRAAANGTLTVAFTRTSTNPVTISATTVGLIQSSVIIISMPARGFQRLVAVSTVPRVNVGARTTFQVTPRVPTAHLDCPSDCKGHPPVTLAFTNPVGAATTAFFPVRAGVVDTHHSVILAGGKSGNLTFVGTHREVVGWAYQVLYGGHWSSIVIVTKRLFVIDCPPLPVLSFTGSCFCVGKSVVFTIPVNTGLDAQAITINGRNVAVATHGHSASFKVVLGKAPVTIGVATEKINHTWLTRNFLTLAA